MDLRLGDCRLADRACAGRTIYRGHEMKKTSLQFLKACSLSVALLGSVAIVAAVSMPDVAFAKSGNDNGGGNGNGGDARQQER